MSCALLFICNPLFPLTHSIFGQTMTVSDNHTLVGIYLPIALVVLLFILNYAIPLAERLTRWQWLSYLTIMPQHRRYILYEQEFQDYMRCQEEERARQERLQRESQDCERAAKEREEQHLWQFHMLEQMLPQHLEPPETKFVLQRASC